MKPLALLTFFVFSAGAVEKPSDGGYSIEKFEISAPVSGRYSPGHDHGEILYAGEIIVLKDSTFHYTTFSDALDFPNPDYSGKLSVFKDHIFLDHPGMRFPYRISGLADGVPVLMSWEGFEQWKKTKKTWGVLFLEKSSEPKK